MIRILLVEDYGSTRDALKLLLEMNGYSVLCADSIESGIRVFNEQESNAVVTDLSMIGPRDGEEILIEIMKGGSSVPVFCITGSADFEDVSKCFTGIFTKPLKFAGLLDAIKESVH